MKRSEIKPGDELYYDPATDWATRGYDYGRRAVVVDDERYKIIRRSTWDRRPDSYVQDPKGTAVMVDLHNGADGDSIRKAVPMAHLRGPWAETLAAVEAAARKKQADDAAQSKRLTDAWAAASTLVGLAKAAGITTAEMRRNGRGMPVIEISTEEFAKLLDAYRPE